jgi:hypothetical protein
VFVADPEKRRASLLGADVDIFDEGGSVPEEWIGAPWPDGFFRFPLIAPTEAGAGLLTALCNVA